MPKNIEEEETKKAFPLASADLTNEVRDDKNIFHITFPFGL